MVRRDPAARPSGDDVLRRLRAPGPATPAATPEPTGGGEAPLIGRQAHLAALAGAFAESRAGKVVVAAVHSRSGAGKSALLRCFLDGVAEAGEAVALSGRCYEQESGPTRRWTASSTP